MIVLPFAPEVFILTSVELTKSDQGHWKRRFRKLWRETPEAMREEMGLPLDDDAYARCNRRLMELARAHGKVHLIALWDEASVSRRSFASGLPVGKLGLWDLQQFHH
ncbi:hypothetical protein NKI82_05500 [Mesorhizobium sp. M0482]|uniref:hypothetical protein n=1 Tax=Mesorhizobium sp. M0482 TaxID=2956948 RepID=UPI00333C7926